MANKKNDQQMPSWVPRLVAIIILSILAIVVTVFIIVKLAGLISLILVALFLSFALEPLVNRLVNTGWNRTAATGTILFGFVVSILILIGAMVPLVLNQITEVVKQGPVWVANISHLFEQWFGISVSQVEITNQLKGANGLAVEYASDITGNILGISKQVLVGALQVLAILLFTFYFVADAPHLRRLICSFLPPKIQWQVLKTWELAIDKTGGYMLSRALLGAISAGVTLVVLLALGVPFALPLALWMGIVSQILPVVGTYLAASLPLLVALIAKPSVFLPLLLFIIIYQQIENYIFSPRITAHTMELHPAVAFAAVIAGGSVAGVVGALLALPLAAILQESTREYLKRHELVESRMFHSTPKKRKK